MNLLKDGRVLSVTHTVDSRTDSRPRDSPVLSSAAPTVTTGGGGGDGGGGGASLTCGGVGVEEGRPTGGVEFLLPEPPAMISSVMSLPP